MNHPKPPFAAARRRKTDELFNPIAQDGDPS